MERDKLPLLKKLSNRFKKTFQSLKRWKSQWRIMKQKYRLFQMIDKTQLRERLLFLKILCTMLRSQVRKEMMGIST
jgi:hypothetical protein